VRFVLVAGMRLNGLGMTKKIQRLWLALDGERLGELEYRGADMFWIYGVFHPAPAFEKLRELFEKLESQWDDESGDEAIDLLDEVNLLNLIAEDEQGQTRKIRDFKINAGWFEFRYA
jgi:hypothetical protein